MFKKRTSFAHNISVYIVNDKQCNNEALANLVVHIDTWSWLQPRDLAE